MINSQNELFQEEINAGSNYPYSSTIFNFANNSVMRDNEQLYQSKVGIFIPCYNVEPFIEKVIRDIPDDVYNRIDLLLITDNKSEDRTREVILETREKMGRRKIKLLCNRENYNLGGSYKIAFDYFIKHKFDYFINVAGRGQGQSGEDISRFLKIIDSDQTFDFIGCSRFHRESELTNYPFLRTIGNYVVICLQRFATGNKMTDPGTGHFCIDVHTLSRIPFYNLTNKRHLNNELQMRLRMLDAKMMELSQVWRAFKYEKAKFNIWSLGFEIVFSIAKFYLTIKGIKKFREFSDNREVFEKFEYEEN